MCGLGMDIASALAIAHTLEGIHHRCVHHQSLYSLGVIPIDQKLERGKDWRLTPTQLDKFHAYTSSTYLLLERLDVAAVEDRAAILDLLLILPSQPDISTLPQS